MLVDAHTITTSNPVSGHHFSTNPSTLCPHLSCLQSIESCEFSILVSTLSLILSNVSVSPSVSNTF